MLFTITSKAYCYLVRPGCWRVAEYIGEWTEVGEYDSLSAAIRSAPLETTS